MADGCWSKSIGRAFGIDLASNPTRRAALERSRDSGKAIASARIHLAQEVGKQSGFLIFVTIYAQGRSIETVDKRREHLYGFALGVFRVGGIVMTSFKNLDRTGINVRMTWSN